MKQSKRVWLKGIAICVLLLGLGAGATGWMLCKGIIWLNMPSFRRYPVQGLDVSGHQGRIDWKQVAAGPWSFVYLKASEGGDFRDPAFAANWQASRDAGLLRGAYHYFTFCRSGAEQAANFIAAVPAEAEMLPPVADLEFGGNCSKRPKQQELMHEVGAFLDALAAHYHRRPALYVTDTFAKAYLAHGELAGYALWVRDIVREPAEFNGRAWQLWQFSNRGHVPGISGFVDQNVFAGSPAAFRRFVQPR